LLKDTLAKAVVADPESSAIEPDTNVKKPFIEPEIQQPVDVLEATTFFVSTTSGAV
jgi:hypothetical protein